MGDQRGRIVADAYDPNVDYKQLHMDYLFDWGKEFRGHPRANDWSLSDAQMMTDIHKLPNCNNYVAWTFYANDFKRKHGKALRREMEKEEANKILGLAPVPDVKTWFVTVGFDKHNFTVAKGVKCVEQFLTYDWVVGCKIVMEFYGENGWRPHIMMRLNTPTHIGKKKVCRSVLAECIFKSSGFRRYRILEALNHVDVKPFMSHHDKYLSLDKEDGKLEYLIRDDEFRKNEGIPEFWEK